MIPDRHARGETSDRDNPQTARLSGLEFLLPFIGCQTGSLDSIEGRRGFTSSGQKPVQSQSPGDVACDRVIRIAA